MWNHLAVVAMAATASVAAAESLIAVDGMHHGAAPAPVEAAAPMPADFRIPTDASVAKAPDGHFWADADVEGRRVRFLVDTGATIVALTPADAQSLGLDLNRLEYNQTVHTASGDARAALVDLDYIAVAGARVERVQAMVIEQGLTTSLLGMTYLGRLSRFEATPDSLILRP